MSTLVDKLYYCSMFGQTLEVFVSWLVC